MNQEEIARALGLPDRSTISRWTARLLPLHVKGADYTEQEIQVLTEYAREHKSRLHVNVQTNIARVEVPMIVQERTIEPPIARDEYDFTHVQDDVQNRILERLEAIERQIAGLHALLAARETAEDARDERPKRQVNYTPRKNRPKRSEGTRLSLFAGLHGVPPRTAWDQVNREDGPKVKIVPINSHQEYYVLPEQEAGIIAYWQRVGYPFSRCPECDHTQEVQE